MRITFEFECGEKTCAVESGKFCMFRGVKHYGQESCCLFPEFFDTKLFDAVGWVARCPACLEKWPSKKDAGVLNYTEDEPMWNQGGKIE
jgi:hypothetical protein